jgi:putative SOS response-associated peptidase YedK
MVAEFHHHHHRSQRSGRSVHSRIPVILRPSDYYRWLSREESDPEHLPLDLLLPYPAEEREAHSGVGNVRNTRVEMLNSE